MKKNRIFTPSPNTSLLKERDHSWGWDVRIDERFFIGRNPGNQTCVNITRIGADIDILGISELPIRPADEIWQIPRVEVALI
jgi:hypothetical protein